MISFNPSFNQENTQSSKLKTNPTTTNHIGRKIKPSPHSLISQKSKKICKQALSNLATQPPSNTKREVLAKKVTKNSHFEFMEAAQIDTFTKKNFWGHQKTDSINQELSFLQSVNISKNLDHRSAYLNTKTVAFLEMKQMISQKASLSDKINEEEIKNFYKNFNLLEKTLNNSDVEFSKIMMKPNSHSGKFCKEILDFASIPLINLINNPKGENLKNAEKTLNDFFEIVKKKQDEINNYNPDERTRLDTELLAFTQNLEEFIIDFSNFTKDLKIIENLKPNIKNNPSFRKDDFIETNKIKTKKKFDEIKEQAGIILILAEVIHLENLNEKDSFETLKEQALTLTRTSQKLNSEIQKTDLLTKKFHSTLNANLIGLIKENIKKNTNTTIELILLLPKEAMTALFKDSKMRPYLGLLPKEVQKEQLKENQNLFEHISASIQQENFYSLTKKNQELWIEKHIQFLKFASIPVQKAFIDKNKEKYFEHASIFVQLIKLPDEQKKSMLSTFTSEEQQEFIKKEGTLIKFANKEEQIKAVIFNPNLISMCSEALQLDLIQAHLENKQPKWLSYATESVQNQLLKDHPNWLESASDKVKENFIPDIPDEDYKDIDTKNS